MNVTWASRQVGTYLMVVYNIQVRSISIITHNNIDIKGKLFKNITYVLYVLL